jgi:hypothetical protein
MAWAQLACSGVGKVGRLTTDAVVASMGLAPLQCGTSLGIRNTRGMYRVGRAISIPPPNEPRTINRWLSHTCGDRAASEVSSYTHFSWISDFLLIPEIVWDIMRGGRARWKIENETFNTLKNQGYHLEHNFGHGEQNLSVVLAMLMMLAFLVDQVQQLCCPLFQAAWHKMKTKRHLWEELRNHFRTLLFDSMADLLTALIRGIAPQKPVFEDTS